jgi:epoxyqueuosine reductase
MRLLLHSCCGPCTIYPLSLLRTQGHTVTGFFHNPNIHPFKEFRRRIQALETVAQTMDLPLIVDQDYGLTPFLRQVVFQEQHRCPLCYRMRLDRLVQQAMQDGYEGFTTTLLYSRYQNHELIRSLCQDLAEANGISFIYHDFRQGWQEGIDRSIAMEIYRQPYCGCIYSEQERYDRSLRSKNKQRAAAKKPD